MSQPDLNLHVLHKPSPAQTVRLTRQRKRRLETVRIIILLKYLFLLLAFCATVIRDRFRSDVFPVKTVSKHIKDIGGNGVWEVIGMVATCAGTLHSRRCRPFTGRFMGTGTQPPRL
jgi:hypothetical protein